MVCLAGQVYDAYGLGLGEPLAISAAHNEGMSDLWQKLIEVGGGGVAGGSGLLA